jgi:hypothetical protein
MHRFHPVLRHFTFRGVVVVTVSSQHAISHYCRQKNR